MCDVLVLDDDPLVRMLVVEVLTESGFSVAGASCLQEARCILASQAFCRILVVDHDLGEADRANGFDFARERLAVSDRVAVVYMTGRWHLLDGKGPTARERHLRKPFRLAEMVGSVQELLQAA